MKTTFGFLAFIPSLFFGLELHLFELQDTLKIQTQNNLNLVRMLFASKEDEERSGLAASFNYSKESSHTNYGGSLSLFTKFEDDDCVLLPYLTYSYSQLRAQSKLLSSNKIGAGAKSIIHTDLLSLFSGIGLGGSFNDSEESKHYSYLFADAQLGLGKRFDFFDDALIISPLSYLEYDYLYQDLKQFSQTQHLHSLALLLGMQFDLGLVRSDDFMISLSCFGFYKHLFLGEKLQDDAPLAQSISRAKDLGYAGVGLSWRSKDFFLDLDVSAEFKKTIHSLQTLARIGIEF